MLNQASSDDPFQEALCNSSPGSAMRIRAEHAAATSVQEHGGDAAIVAGPAPGTTSTLGEDSKKELLDQALDESLMEAKEQESADLNKALLLSKIDDNQNV